MASGKCGDNLTWTLDDEGTLTISGRGYMDDYTNAGAVPWVSSRKLIRKVVFTSTVSSISADAFSNCKNLTSVIILGSLTAIGRSAFHGCTNLITIDISDSVKRIGKKAFCDCKKLTSVIIPNSVTTISPGAFCDCKKLTSIIIPDSVTTIGHRAFSACKSLPSIKIPDSVTAISDWAFCACKNLTNVIIPDSVTTIGARAFSDCERLKEIHYPSGRGFEKVLSEGNNAKLIPYDELPSVQVKPPAQVEPPTQVKPPAQAEPPAQAKPPAQVNPPAQIEPPVQVEPPAETNCTVYRNTKTARPENIAPHNAKKLKLVDENIAEIRRAAELAAMNIVMTIERDLGFSPEDVSSQNLGYDIKSTSRDGKISRLIEVKGRHIDAETVTVSRNEIDAALNNPDNFILAIVRLDGGTNETIYIRKPFELPPDRAALSVNFSIQKLVDVSEIVPG